MRGYIDRLEIAQNHFDWASSPGEVDAAIYELQAAELLLSNYVEKVKEEKETEICE
jgi:hypothetical protein